MGGKRGANALQNEISSVRRSKRFRPGIEQKLDADEEIHDERDLSPEVALRNKEELRNRAKGSGRSKEGEKEEQLTLKNNELTCQGDIYVDNPLAREGRKEEEEVISGKASSRGNTKDETSDQAMPLAARTPGLRMCIGAHVSAAKGVHNAVTNSVHIGGNAFALFLKSQRKWDNPPLQDDHRDQFRKLCVDHQYDATRHILPHGSYLVNLAQDEETKAKQAYDSFLDDLRRCEQLGITLYNFHPGTANKTSSSSAITRLAKALTKALSETSTVIPVLETMCGQGTTIGGSFTDFQSLISLVPSEYHSRIGICIDTCHSFAAGYDLASPGGFQSFMTEFDELVGLRFLRALHLNDSKTPRGSKRDLHANIGTGFLGLRAFHNVMNEKRFEGLPMILETPIDRPDPSWNPPNSSDQMNDAESPKKKGPKKKPVSSKTGPSNTKKPPMIEDKSVWAREIKLLESLIGMDPEGSEFRELEARLAEEGRSERLKHQEQYDRKHQAEAKKLGKGQRTLSEMMSGKAKQNAKVKGKRMQTPDGSESQASSG
jgi:AP endonuclease-1